MLENNKIKAMFQKNQNGSSLISNSSVISPLAVGLNINSNFLKATKTQRSLITTSDLQATSNASSDLLKSKANNFRTLIIIFSSLKGNL